MISRAYRAPGISRGMMNVENMNIAIRDPIKDAEWIPDQRHNVNFRTLFHGSPA
jgi:hypothetical protein